jgi:superfamily II RNA helicase
MVYEPRPGTTAPKTHRLSRRLAHRCEQPLMRIHKEEAQFRVVPKTKSPSFHLTHAIEAWMHRLPFAKLTRLCDADEGEIVRYFRMTVQLLRQLSGSPAGSETLRAMAAKGLERINRDVVDAEAQLRLG